MASQAASTGDAEEEDEEVMRIPVFNRPSAAGHSLYLFQCPLRPQWRPYDLNSVSEAQVRPLQRRVDLKLPVKCPLGSTVKATVTSREKPKRNWTPSSKEYSAIGACALRPLFTNETCAWCLLGRMRRRSSMAK